MKTADKPLAFFVDDNEHQRKLISCFTEFRPVVDAELFASVEEAVAAFATLTPQIVYLDNQLHPHRCYRETVPLIRDAGYDGPIIVMSADISPLREKASDHDPDVTGVIDFLDKADLQLNTFSDLIGQHLSL